MGSGLRKARGAGRDWSAVLQLGAAGRVGVGVAKDRTMALTTSSQLVRNHTWFQALCVCVAVSFTAGCGHVTRAETQASPNGSARAVSEPRVCQGRVVESDQELLALSACSEIAGDLRITRTNVTSLSALSRLCAVSGTLELSNNRHLSTLRGLGRLSRVGQLSLRDNPRLASLAALRNLTDLRVLVIEGAPALVDSSGLERVRRLETLTIRRTGLSKLGGLSNLGVVEHLALLENAYLVSVRALARLEQVTTVELRENPLLYGGAEEFFPRLLRAESVSLSGNFSISRGELATFRQRVVVQPDAGEVHASR